LEQESWISRGWPFAFCPDVIPGIAYTTRVLTPIFKLLLSFIIYNFLMKPNVTILNLLWS
jgi:hypothetical protein